MEEKKTFVCDLQLDTGEERRSSARVNHTEVKIVLGICASLLTRGLQPNHIGVISPYRAQVGLLRRSALSAFNGLASGVDVRTIDQFQGNDRECIIISFVRSNPNDS